MSYGSRGHIGIGKETAWGTEQAASVYLPFVSESLGLDIEQVISAAQRGIVDESPSYPGIRNVGGDVDLEVHPGNFGHILRSAFGAPDSSQINTSSAYKHEFEPRQDDFDDDCPLCPYTFEVYRDKGDAFQYKGGVVNNLRLSFGVDEKILRAICGIIGKEYAPITKTTPSFEITDPFKWDQAVIKIATVANNDLESFNFTLDNHLIGVPTCNNTSLISRIYRDAKRTVEVGMTIDFVDQVQFVKFKNQDMQAFEITLEGAEIETGHEYSLIIEIPKLKYTAYPIHITGAGRINSAVIGKAEYDLDLKYAIKVTLINKETAY